MFNGDDQIMVITSQSDTILLINHFTLSADQTFFSFHFSYQYLNPAVSILFSNCDDTAYGPSSITFHFGWPLVCDTMFREV